MLFVKAIGVAGIWVGAATAVVVVVVGVLSVVGAAIPVIATAAVAGTLVGGACLGAGTAASRKL